jgi:hypothetical protein
MRTGLLGGLLLLWTGVAVAGRPLVTEDAGVLGKGECELETFAARERGDDAPTVRGWSAQFGCGVGLGTQLALNATRFRTADERVDGLALVGKTRLRELKEDQAGVVIAYLLGAERPRDGSFRREATAVNAVVTLPANKWLFHANLGWANSRSADINYTTWAIAAERTEIGSMDLAVESFGDDRNPAWVQVAARWTVAPEKVFLDASYGVQLSGARPMLLTVGVKVAF